MFFKVVFVVVFFLEENTLLPRLTVHALLSGFLRIWTFRNDEKSDPLNGACTDIRVTMHALLRGGTVKRVIWVVFLCFFLQTLGQA